MASWKRITAPDVPDMPVFAHAAVAGDQIYVSGMIGVEPDLSRLVEGGVAAGTRQALGFMERILNACGASQADVVKVNVYLTDLEEWEAMNEVYLEVFGDHTPARIAIGCAGLLFGAAVEFDFVAHSSGQAG